MSSYGNYPNPYLCRNGCIKIRNTFVMGCPGCNLSQVEKQNLKTVAYNEAVKFANKIQKLVVTYEDDEGRSFFMEAEAARSTGVRITGYVPFVPDPNNG